MTINSSTADNDDSFSCFINVSSNSVSELGWTTLHPDDLDFDLASNSLTIAIILTVQMLIGLPWNAFIMWVIIRKRLCTQPAHMLMLNLSTTNFLLGVLVMPFNIISAIATEFIFGGSDLVRCRVCQIGVVVIILPWVSIHTLCLMSVDRFIYLKRPLSYKFIVTPKKTFAVIARIWLLCTALAIPPLFGFGEIKFAYTVASCVPLVVGETHLVPNFYYVLLLLAEILVPIVILFVMYVCVICITRKFLIRKFNKDVSMSFIHNKKEEGNMLKRKDLRKKHNKKQLHLVKLFGAIFTANIVTWIPMIVLVLTGAILGAKRIPTLVFSIAYLSYLSITVIQPVLEAIIIREIRFSILECFTLFWKKKKLKDGSSSASGSQPGSVILQRKEREMSNRSIKV